MIFEEISSLLSEGRLFGWLMNSTLQWDSNGKSQKMFIWRLHWLLTALSMDLSKKPRKMNGRSVYAVSFIERSFLKIHNNYQLSVKTFTLIYYRAWIENFPSTEYLLITQIWRLITTANMHLGKIPSFCYTPRQRRGVIVLTSCVCLCVCASVCPSVRLTILAEWTDIQYWILACRSSLSISRLSLNVKVIGQRSRSWQQILFEHLSLMLP